jgi:hypothetical protein
VTTKAEYTKNPDVTGFIDWLNNTSNDFMHSYIQERTKTEWKCSSLYDAFHHYDWPYSFQDRSGRILDSKMLKGHHYDESAQALAYIKSELVAAIKNKNTKDAANACLMILEWGGVLGTASRGNWKKVIDLNDDLIPYLRGVKSYFESDDISLVQQRQSHFIKINGKKTKIIMNAGFTKIYSILCTDFIIYDGRVGAALGLLVRKFLESKNYSAIPNVLDFRFGNAKTKSVNRNPSSENFKFSAFNNSDALHTNSNLMANWIIEKIDLDKYPEFKKSNDPTRALEAALFMIGYRV